MLHIHHNAYHTNGCYIYITLEHSCYIYITILLLYIYNTGTKMLHVYNNQTYVVNVYNQGLTPDTHARYNETMRLQLMHPVFSIDSSDQ